MTDAGRKIVPTPPSDDRLLGDSVLFAIMVVFALIALLVAAAVVVLLIFGG